MSNTIYTYSLADDDLKDYTCYKCGCTWSTVKDICLDWRYCPECGRKILSILPSDVVRKTTQTYNRLINQYFDWPNG